MIQKIVNWVLYVDGNFHTYSYFNHFLDYRLIYQRTAEPFTALNRIKLNAKILEYYNILLM